MSISCKVDDESEDSSQTATLLGTLAQALLSAGRHIEELHVSQVNANQFSDTDPFRHVFRGLRYLNIQFQDGGFLREDEPRSPVLMELFKCAQPTLESLVIGGSTTYLERSSSGTHTLLNMLSGGITKGPIVFPELRILSLQKFTLSTIPLVRFLDSQPKISNLDFYRIYLSTPDQGWSFLAGVIPETVQTWTIDESSQVYAGTNPMEPEEFVSWNPLKDPLPMELGWSGTQCSSGCKVDFQRV